jgi:hypothetical protein
VPSDKEIIAYKIGARARKFLGEDCPIEGYEVLFGALAEVKASGDVEMQALLEREIDKYEERVTKAEEAGG